MKTGMMWFDADKKKPLAEKVTEAAAFYRKKYQAVADACMVNPGAVGEPMVEVMGITVRPMKAILPGCLWIGVEEAK